MASTISPWAPIPDDDLRSRDIPDTHPTTPRLRRPRRPSANPTSQPASSEFPRPQGPANTNAPGGARKRRSSGAGERDRPAASRTNRRRSKANAHAAREPFEDAGAAGDAPGWLAKRNAVPATTPPAAAPPKPVQRQSRGFSTLLALLAALVCSIWALRAPTWYCRRMCLVPSTRAPAGQPTLDGDWLELRGEFSRAADLAGARETDCTTRLLRLVPPGVDAGLEINSLVVREFPALLRQLHAAPPHAPERAWARLRDSINATRAVLERLGAIRADLRTVNSTAGAECVSATAAIRREAKDRQRRGGFRSSGNSEDNAWNVRIEEHRAVALSAFDLAALQLSILAQQEDRRVGALAETYRALHEGLQGCSEAIHHQPEGTRALQHCIVRCIKAFDPGDELGLHASMDDPWVAVSDSACAFCERAAMRAARHRSGLPSGLSA